VGATSEQGRGWRGDRSQEQLRLAAGGYGLTMIFFIISSSCENGSRRAADQGVGEVSE
jgi:hypothetical protein